MRKFAAILLGFIFSTALLAQTPAEVHSAIHAAAFDRNYPAAIEQLRILKTKELAIFQLNNYDYLLARLSEKNGDFAAAMAGYQGVAARNSIFKEYALWHISRIAHSSGNLMLERIYLQELMLNGPNSLLFDAAKNCLARSWFDSGNYDLAIKALDAGIAQPQRSSNSRLVESPILRENRLLVAQSYFRTGNTAAARENFTQLLGSMANPAQPDDFALAAVEGLDILDAGAGNVGKPALSLGDFEHLRRANIYQFNRDFTGARLHYSAIINNYPASGIVPDAIYQIGRGYGQAGNFTEAVGWFERVVEQFPDHPVSKDALLQAALAYSRLTKSNEATARYKKYIEKYPDDERVDRAYLNIIDVLRDQGEEIEAQKWAVKVQEVFKGKPPEAVALFSEIRIYISRNDWPKARAGLEKLQSFPYSVAGVPGGANASEIAFLNGLLLEQMQRYEEAIDIYLSIPDGRNEYYGGRATERLKLLANDEVAKPIINVKLNFLTAGLQSKDPDVQRTNTHAALRLTETPELRTILLENLKKAYSNLSAYKKIPGFKLLEPGRREIALEKRSVRFENIHRHLAAELLFLGLYDEAAPEFEVSAGNLQSTQSKDFDYTLAVHYKRGDKADRAIAFAEPLWRGVPADYQIDLIPKEQLELLYPAPYPDLFLKYASPRNIDSRFLLAIMRQESRFRPDVKSYAAARGLMQFISATAEKIAGELGREDFRQDDLYNPSTAILFGSQYASSLFKLFPNQPQAVAASYNGGEDNMNRWLKRSHSDLPDRYVPEIAFSQTKDYVYKVMANYRVYQMLYDENLKVR